MLNQRLARFWKLRLESDGWTMTQIPRAAQALSLLLHQINVGAVPVQALAPGRFHTNVELIDGIANQMYILLYHELNARSEENWGPLPEVSETLPGIYPEPFSPAPASSADSSFLP